MAETDLLAEARGPVMWITINRDERRNALNDDVVNGIRAAMARAGADPAMRAVVLTGVGERAFCAGADLAPDSGSFQYDFSKIGSPFVSMLKEARALTLPLIARVNGHCVAGGMGLLGMCDMAITADHATFGMPEVRIGVFPMMIMTVLQHIIPPRKLHELALTGERIAADEALEFGLVNYVVPKTELDARTDWLLARLLDKSPTGIRRGKHAMRQIQFMNFDESIAFMETQIATLALTEDAKEGRLAFNEKRPPDWPGR